MHVLMLVVLLIYVFIDRHSFELNNLFGLDFTIRLLYGSVGVTADSMRCW